VTARTYYEWQLVGYGSDPVPVDQWDVDDIADDMRERATKASSVRDTLSKLSDLEGWTGKAAEEFAGKAGDVLEDLGKVVDRYEDVAAAIDWWAGAVGTARTRTAQAVQDAEDAQKRIESNDIDVASGADPSQALLDQQSQADGRKAIAQGDLSDAQTAMRNAMEALDDAAETAKGKIDDAADNWDDGAWGNVKGVLRKGADFVEFMCAALEIIAAILGVIILVLVLTIGAPFALLIAALVVSLAILAGHLFLMMVDEGDVTWGDIGIDMLNVALSMTGLKLLGPAVTNGLRGLQAAVPAIATRAGSASRMAAVSRLANGQTRLYENALRFANPAGRLGQWAQNIRRQADIADVVENTRVLAMINRQPGALSTMLRGDRELAQLHTLVQNLRTAGSGLGPLELGQLRYLQQLVHAGTAVNATSAAIMIGKDLPDVPDNVQTVIDYLKDHPVEVGFGAGTGVRPVP
jgi:uncharacterized protein YukE